MEVEKYSVEQTTQRIRLACALLVLYGVTETAEPQEIADFKTDKSKLYGHTNVYRFDYSNKRYYVTDDYSLCDNPAFIEDVFKDVYPSINGELRKNPLPQPDGATYAAGLDGVEYYLWEESTSQ